MTTNPFILFPALVYTYVAIKFAWHIARIDGKSQGQYIDIICFVLVVVFAPIAWLIAFCAPEGEYDGFKLLPPIPSPPSDWDREKKRIQKEREAADLALEQARVRTEHRRHLEKRRAEVDKILEAEADRLLENDQ